MLQGLSIANDLLANSVVLNIDYNQRQLQNVVAQLASGLRIGTAADDPSGLAIATSLQTQVDGFSQAVSNVQNANNAAQVALGALTSTTQILQRIRSLAVEAASDVNSQDDRANLQTEVSQLLLEINRISQNTSFNGQPLLDGSHAGFVAEQSAYVTIAANAALATSGNGKLFGGAGAATTFAFGDVTLTGLNTSRGAPLVKGAKYQLHGKLVDAGTSPGAAAKLWFNANTLFTANATVASVSKGAAKSFSKTVTAGTYNHLHLAAVGGKAKMLNVVFTPIGPTKLKGTSGVNTGFLIACAVAANAQFNTTVGPFQGYRAGGGKYATVDGSIEVQVVDTGVSIAAQETFINSATGQISVSPELLSPLSITAIFDNVKLALGDFTAPDIGVTAYLKISQNVAALTNPANPAFAVQSGANEGDVIAVGIAATNTQTLRVSNVNVAISSASNPSLGAQDAIGQIDIALGNLLQQQARLGAVVVRLNADENDDDTAAVNLQAAEANIRDLNVGAATTQFTRLQILVQTGDSVLAQSNLNAQSVLPLFR